MKEEDIRWRRRGHYFSRKRLLWLLPTSSSERVRRNEEAGIVREAGANSLSALPLTPPGAAFGVAGRASGSSVFAISVAFAAVEVERRIWNFACGAAPPDVSAAKPEAAA